MLSRASGLASRLLGLVLVAALFAAILQTDPSFARVQTTTLSAPDSAVLLTQQPKFAVARPQRPDQDIGHPADLPPVVAVADFAPHGVTTARRVPASSLEPAAEQVGWQARAPPLPIMSVKS